MLDKYLDLIRKYPKRLAIGGGLWLLICLVSIISSPKTNQPRIQEQTQAQSKEPSDDVDGADTEPFNRNKCKVYTVGIVSGAIVHQFKTTGNTQAYVMVTDRDQVVRIFENNNLYLWKTRQDFQNTEYAELVQVLPPESVQELNRLVSIYSYAAIGTEAIARSAHPTLFDSNKCSVD